MKKNHMKRKILVVAAHPDDELLGAAGTLIKHRRAGDAVHCLIMAEGLDARGKAPRADLAKLHQDARAAGKIIGFRTISFAHLPDNAMDTVSLLSITKIVEDHIGRIRPDVIYTHHDNDLNVDHRLTCQAVITACRPCNDDAPREIYTFETLSSTEWQTKANPQFSPNTYVDIAGVIDQKVAAMEKYTSEIRKYPHSRSAAGIKILAQYRGLESGLRFAEAFRLIRRVDK